MWVGQESLASKGSSGEGDLLHRMCEWDEPESPNQPLTLSALLVREPSLPAQKGCVSGMKGILSECACPQKMYGGMREVPDLKPSPLSYPHTVCGGSL